MMLLGPHPRQNSRLVWGTSEIIAITSVAPLRRCPTSPESVPHFSGIRSKPRPTVLVRCAASCFGMPTTNGKSSCSPICWSSVLPPSLRSTKSAGKSNCFSRRVDSSALARNYHTLLAKNYHHHTALVSLLPAGKSTFLPHCKSNTSQGSCAPAYRCLARSGRLLMETERLTRAFSADDGEPPRTPTAWMILLVHCLPHAKSCSKSCSWCRSV